MSVQCSRNLCVINMQIGTHMLVTPSNADILERPRGHRFLYYSRILLITTSIGRWNVVSGRFVRFADDVVALCSTYAEAEEIEATFIEHCQASGLVINEKKSPGIAIISKKEAELRSYRYFDYLGYRFAKSGLKVPDRVFAKITSKLSRLIHLYLIQYPDKYGFCGSRCQVTRPPYDWDLLGLILEVRRYLYGGLDEKEVRDFLNGGQQLRRMRGLMGFYALLEDFRRSKEA